MGIKEYSVIKILSETKIIIDYGAVDGAKQGDNVKVIRIGPEVIHPKTNEVIGTLDPILAKLEIITVYEHFSVCADVARYERNILGPLTDFVQRTTEYKPLNIDKEQIETMGVETDAVIKVGDFIEVL